MSWINSRRYSFFFSFFLCGWERLFYFEVKDDRIVFRVSLRCVWLIGRSWLSMVFNFFWYFRVFVLGYFRNIFSCFVFEEMIFILRFYFVGIRGYLV